MIHVPLYYELDHSCSIAAAICFAMSSISDRRRRTRTANASSRSPSSGNETSPEAMLSASRSRSTATDPFSIGSSLPPCEWLSHACSYRSGLPAEMECRTIGSPQTKWGRLARGVVSPEVKQMKITQRSHRVRIRVRNQPPFGWDTEPAEAPASNHRSSRLTKEADPIGLKCQSIGSILIRVRLH